MLMSKNVNKDVSKDSPISVRESCCIYTNLVHIYTNLSFIYTNLSLYIRFLLYIYES